LKVGGGFQENCDNHQMPRTIRTMVRPQQARELPPIAGFAAIVSLVTM
jgi:hypothetical protein